MAIAPCPTCSGRLESLISCSRCGTDTPKPGIHLERAPCPACGQEAEVSFQCPECGSVFAHEQVFTEEEGGEMPSTYACPFCGTFVSEDESNCPGCGALFAPEPEAPLIPRKLRRKRGEYSQEDVEELLRVPGIGRLRAEILCEAGYNSLRRLRGASIEELSKVRQIGPKVARSIKSALRSVEETPSPEEILESLIEQEFECPACGVIVSAYDSSCFECGTVFQEEPLDAAMRVELEHVGESTSSLAFFDMKILEEPSDPDLWFSRANILRTMGKLEEALESFDRVIALRPDDRRAYIARADILTQLDRFAEAADAYRAVIAQPLPAAPKEFEQAALDALMELEEAPCPSCGEPVPHTAPLCPNCGADVVPPPGEGPEGEVPELEAIMELERLAGPPPPPLETRVVLPRGKPVGLINGVSLVNGRGRVNGRIDRKGFINGSGMSEATLGRPRLLLPRYIAIAIALVLLFALGYPLLPPPSPAALTIAVDGNPADWAGVPTHFGTETTANPDVDLTTYGLRLDDGFLFFLMQVRGAALGDDQGMDAALVFLDADGDAGTGYLTGEFGADFLVQVYGGDGEVLVAELHRYSATGGFLPRTNWTAWDPHGRVLAAAANGTLEVRVDTLLFDDYDEEAFSAWIHLDDQAGNVTRSLQIGRNRGALLLTPLIQGDAVVARGAAEVVGTLDLRASGANVTLESVTVEINGAPANASLNVITVPEGGTAQVLLRTDTTPFASGALLDVRVTAAVARGPEGLVPVTIGGGRDVVALETSSTTKSVDGWFGDWQDLTELTADNDTTPAAKPGLDVDRLGSNESGGLGFLYLGFLDDAMPGDPVPVFRARPPAPAPGPAPVSPPVLEFRRGGEDTTRFYIDTNSTDAFGTLVVVGSDTIRADLRLTVRSLYGRVVSATLDRWAPGWMAVPGGAQASITGPELEAAADLTGFGERNATEYLVTTSDWRGRGDVVTTQASWGTRGGTRGEPEPEPLFSGDGQNAFVVTGTVDFVLDAETYKISMRFTAQNSFSITGVRVYFVSVVDPPVYEGGLQADSSGSPSGSFLCSGTATPIVGWVVFPCSTSISSGTIYHLVVEWDSGTIGLSNSGAVRYTTPNNNLYPKDGSTDSATNVLTETGSGWNAEDGQPVYVVNNTSTFEGNPYHTYEEKDIFGTTGWGNKFSVTTDRSFSEARFYVKKVGTPPNDLTMKIRQVSGSPLEVASVSVAPGSVGTAFGWITFTFPPVTLSSAETYAIYLQTTGGDASDKYVVPASVTVGGAPYEDLTFDGTTTQQTEVDTTGPTFTDTAANDIPFEVIPEFPDLILPAALALLIPLVVWRRRRRPRP